MPGFIAADPVASKKWERVVAVVGGAGILNETHGEMLAVLCSSWADLERAREQFAGMNYQQLVVDEQVLANGQRLRRVRPNPLILRIERNAAQVARYLGEFGLTPMTSAKVAASLANPGQVDPFDEYLSGREFGVVQGGKQ
jgi:P27 family predicted phage terminase small subunit